MFRLLLSAIAISTLLSNLSLSATRDGSYNIKEVPYGIEALAQYRSDYRYRGFSLADNTIDLQLSSLYAFSDTVDLSTATWYGTATGSGQFSEFGLMAELSKQFGQFNLGTSATYRGQSYSPLKSGLNLEARAHWGINDQLDISIKGAYDTGAEGWYSDLSGNYFIPMNDDSYFDISLGCSAVNSYYDRDGLNDLFTKFTYTYNINQSISVSPYLGTSTLLDSADQGKDSLHGGLYFAVSF